MRELFSLNNKPFDLTEVNPLIVRYKVPLAYANGIANGFYFSREILSSLINTIKGSGVFTYYDKKSDIYGGHEGDLYKGVDGLKRTPYIYGVGFNAYNEDSVFWETLNLDGVERDWLCTTVYLWKNRFPYLEDLENQISNQSIEVDLNYVERNGIKYVTEAQFEGVVLIGITPAFDGSQFLSFSKKDFSSEVLSLKNELDSLNNASNITDMKEGETINMAKFSKTQKEEFSAKFSMTVNQIKDEMNNLCSAVKYEYENHECTKYYIWDFDDKYMYGYDSQNDNNIAIPFAIDEEGKIIPDFENVKNAKSTSIWVVSEDESFETADDDTTYGSFSKEQLSKIETKCAEKVDEIQTKLSETETELADCKTKLSETETKLVDTEAKMGVQFASITSLETALADEKVISENRQAEIDKLSAELKAKVDDEKLSDAKELMSKKEFSVFSEDKKAEILKLSSDKSKEEFEILAYAELGKFAGTNLEFNSENGKFSYMYVPSTQSLNNKNSEDDVFAELRKKNGIEK